MHGICDMTLDDTLGKIWHQLALINDSYSHLYYPASFSR